MKKRRVLREYPTYLSLYHLSCSFIAFIYDCISDFFFPRRCISCLESCEKKHQLLCSHCFSQLQFILPYERCRLCFYELIPCSPQNKNIHTCSHIVRELKSLGLERYGCCFELTPPLQRILHFFQKELYSKPGSHSLASFFAIQYILLHFPKPDALILLPSHSSLFEGCEFGKMLSSLLRIPYCGKIDTQNQALQSMNGDRLEITEKIKYVLFISDFFNPNTALFFISLLRAQGIKKCSYLALYETV